MSNTSHLLSTSAHVTGCHADDSVLRPQQIFGPNGLLPISRSTFYAKVAAGELPPPIKLGPRISVWRKRDILSYIEKREQR